MSSLCCEIFFCVLFVYFAISTFAAELFNGLLQSFFCVFGLTSIQETDDTVSGFALFYYSYVIIVALLGNVMFVVSFLIYGPLCHTTHTQFVQKRDTEDGQKEVVSPHNRIIYCSRRRLAHICIFTRYDMYSSLVLLFIGAQFLIRAFMASDDFKEIEGLLFKRTIASSGANASDFGCLDEWCDQVYGAQALQDIYQLQEAKQCCGWNEATDWLYYSGQCSQPNQSLPKSCCHGSANCSLNHEMRFASRCADFDLPIRPIVDPTQYANHCFGLYPLFKLMAVISYQFGFRKIFDGSALLIRVNYFFPLNVKII